MERAIAEEQILEDLINTFERYFGFKVFETMPIKRGWLNLKWKITTDSGEFLIKQYNKERYKLYNHEELLQALTHHNQLYKKGLPCPRLYSYQDQILLKSDKGERFILMEFSEGTMIPPGKLDAHQMYGLGHVTGKMHHLLNDGKANVKRQPKFIPPSREERLRYWETAWDQANDNGKLNVLPTIEKQYNTTKVINLEDINMSDTGWAHRDLWVDNLLFKKEKISAVLDFDRVRYDFPQLDVARAVISGALDGSKLNRSAALTFIEGYSEVRPFGKAHLISALRLLWYMESTWWITPDMDQHSVSPERFSKEMMWLSENQNELEAIL